MYSASGLRQRFVRGQTYINVLGDLDISVGDGLQERGLRNVSAVSQAFGAQWRRTLPEPFSPSRPYLAHQLKSRRTCEAGLVRDNIPLTVVERDLGTLNEESAVERQSVLLNLDITSLDVRSEDTVL